MNYDELSRAMIQLQADGKIREGWTVAEEEIFPAEGDKIPSEDQLEEANSKYLANAKREDSRAKNRGKLFDDWNKQPDWITGPYQNQFTSAIELLDQKKDGAAINLIRYEEPKVGFTPKQIAVFQKVKEGMIEAIKNL